MRKRLLYVLFPLALLAAATSNAREIPFPGNDPRTLLRVHSTLSEQPRPDTGIRIDIDRLISRGGGIAVLRSSGLGSLRPEVAAGTALSKPADLAALGQALVDARVATLEDCSLKGFGRTGPVEITWYGRSGRRHTFTILFIDGDPSAESACSPDHRAVSNAIELFEEAAFRNP